LALAAQGFISKRTPFSVVPLTGDGFEYKPQAIAYSRLGKKGSAMQLLMESHMDEGSPHLDIFVVRGPRDTPLYMPFLTRNLDKMITSAPMPVLVARTPKRYRRILVYLHSNCVQEISIAIQICRATGASITALYKPRNSKRAQYLKRFAQVYHVEVEDQKVVGNSTVELIKEVRENHYDLIIIKKEISDIQTSQLRRLVHLWTGSVLLVP